VVHLDIKPDNILLSENGNYKLSDLGLMKSLNDEDDLSTLREGDSRYMAKELLDVTPS
jgi:serine/threonine protein kinase